MRTELWPFQAKALDATRAALKIGKRRPLLYAPTGAGKTTMAAEIVSSAISRGKRVAFTVPAISLVDQTFESFYREGITEVGIIQADHRSTDWSKPVQICSVDTLHRRDAFPKVDLVVVDEAHVVKQGIVRWMGFCERIPFIGLSATPWTKGLGAIYDELVVAATIGELIAGGYLTPTKTFAPSSPDLEGVRTTAGEFNSADLARKADQQALVGDVVDTWLELGRGRPTICFAVDCAHARLLQERFKDAGVSAGYVDHTVELAERAAVMRDFREGASEVLCNVDCLGLGTNLPMVSCVSYARPTRSMTRWVQNIGRGLRISEGKADCLVLDHSDTTLRLGFVDQVGPGKLDRTAKGERKPKAEDEPKPKTCPKCKLAKPPGVRECPECGFISEPQTRARSVEGDLAELDAEGRERLLAKRKGRKYSLAEKQAVYGMLAGHAQSRGFKLGWIAHKYRAFFGCWPRGLGDCPPVTPSPELKSWIVSQNIRHAKRRNR